jgi:NADH-quinone oxidoreductase subunit J
MNWITEHWLLMLALASSAALVWWAMPQTDFARPRGVSLTLAILAGGTVGWALPLASQPLTGELLFWLFGGGAVLCGGLMILSKRPVYSALWFALATLSTCGLFLLQSAPFLAAATIIVYAGAIVVTFLFVIMLAQQAGATVYDQRSRQPLAATLAAFILLGALLTTLQTFSKQHRTPQADAVMPAEESNPLSRPATDQAGGTMQGLGRSLFGDYLFAVEMAGTLLLVASIGAIAVAPRRAEGTL